MMKYKFTINTYEVDVIVAHEPTYHVSLDGVFAGVIYTEFLDEPPFMIWKTRDLIAEDLVQKIGAAIENEDE